MRPERVRKHTIFLLFFTSEDHLFTMRPERVRKLWFLLSFLPFCLYLFTMRPERVRKHPKVSLKYRSASIYLPCDPKGYGNPVHPSSPALRPPIYLPCDPKGYGNSSSVDTACSHDNLFTMRPERVRKLILFITIKAMNINLFTMRPERVRKLQARSFPKK